MRRFVLLLPVLACAVLFAKDSAPDWVMEQSTRAIPKYDGEVPAVTLIDDAHLTIDGSGSAHREMRYVIRILNEEGRRDAVAEIAYFQKVTKVREMKAWLLTPGGGLKAYGKEAISDIAIQAQYELYDDLRARVISAHSPPVGSTFAWEASVDEPLMVALDSWNFQDRNPVLSSRYSLSLPLGWEAKASLFNTDGLQPTVQGTTYTWEMRDLPFIKKEWRTPERLGAWMGVNFYPTTGAASIPLARSWAEVSMFQARLADSQADTNDAMVAKVHALTAAATTPYGRIQAIARYVQQTKYVAIETNLARGGGYQPHLATQVFTKNYGDCKDKANLMRAMLKIAGIDSYLVAIFSGDPYAVHPEWPSPEQFNHMIIAVKVPENVDVPAILVHKQLGRLLIFDPTSESTPSGNIPIYEQRSFALVLAGTAGDLIKVPSTPAETDRENIEITATLGDRGALDASIAIASHGQSAANLRELYNGADANRITELLERWVSSEAKQSTLKNVQPADAFDNDQFALSMDISSPAYAQVMQGRMMIFKPDVLARFGDFESQSDKRLHPLVLQPECYHKSVHVKLPNGFKVDEMPDPASFETKFGKFSSSYKLDGDNFVFTEDLDVTAAMVPASDYSELKKFFQHVYGAERAPLLLMRN